MTRVFICVACKANPALPLIDTCAECEQLFARDWAERVRQQNKPHHTYRLTGFVLPRAPA